MSTLPALPPGVKVPLATTQKVATRERTRTPSKNRREQRERYRLNHLSVARLLVPLYLYRLLRQHHPKLFAGVSGSWAHTPLEVKARLSILCDYLFKRFPDADGQRLVIAAKHLRGMFVCKSAKGAADRLKAWLVGAGVQVRFTDPDFVNKRARSMQLTFHPEVEAAIDEHDERPNLSSDGWVRLDSPTGRPTKDCTARKRHRLVKKELCRALRGCKNEVLRRRLEHFLVKPRSIRRVINRNAMAAREVIAQIPEASARHDAARQLMELERMGCNLPSNRPGKESARIGGKYNPAQLPEQVQRVLFPADVVVDASASWFCGAMGIAFKSDEPMYQEVKSWVDGPDGDPWGELTRRLLPRLEIPEAVLLADPELLKVMRKALKLQMQRLICGAQHDERPTKDLYLGKALPGGRYKLLRGFYEAILDDPIVSELLRRLYGMGGIADELTRCGLAYGKNGQAIYMKIGDFEPFHSRLKNVGKNVGLIEEEGRFVRARRAVAAALAQIEGAAIVAAYDFLKRKGRGRVHARYDSHDGFNIAGLRSDRSNDQLVAGACAAFRRALGRRGCFGRLRVTFDPRQKVAA